MDIIPPSENGLHQRHSSNMPSNLTYAYGDVLAPLIYSDNQFDLVFQRDVANVVPLSKWSQLISEFYRVLKPGGQVELIEYGKPRDRPFFLPCQSDSLKRQHER